MSVRLCMYYNDKVTANMILSCICRIESDSLERDFDAAIINGDRSSITG